MNTQGRVENCLRRVPKGTFIKYKQNQKPGKEIGAPELNKHNFKRKQVSVKVCKEGPYQVYRWSAAGGNKLFAGHRNAMPWWE